MYLLMILKFNEFAGCPGEILRDVLINTQERLRAGDYKTEEHVRFSLVGRIIQLLRWDI